MITALVLWLAVAVLAGLVAGRFIRTGASDRQASACNQNCQQGRGCTCGTTEAAS